MVETKEEYVELSDKITEILLLLEKADVLSDDIYISFFEYDSIFGNLVRNFI